MIKRLLYTLIVMLATTPMAMASSYLINITSNDGGNVTVNKMSGSAEAGDLIKVFIHPDNDLWALQSLSIVRDDNGSNIDYDDYYDQNYEAYSFTMPASNVSINATFMRAFYSITVNNDDADGQGYATVDVTRAATDSVVTATVTPLDGFRIMGLQVIEDNTGNEIIATSIGNNQYSFTIGNDDVTVTPLFTPAPYFPIYTSETQNGTINTDVSGFEGANMFAYTEPERGYVTDSLWVMVETENAAPYQLEGVTKIGENSYIFIMPECVSVTIYATFKKADYFVNYEDGIEHGTVSETNPGAAHHFNDAVTLTITPEENYVLKHLTITDGEYNELEYTWITEGESLTFNMPYSSVVVDASFRYTIYEIEVCDVEHATITPNVNMAQVGDTVTFTITPDLGYMITEIKVLAGYEIHGGSNPHAPLKSQGMWYTQDEIHLNYIDDTHYSFVLPERFYDDITPNYTGETKFRIIASLQNLGPRVIWCEGNKTLYFDFEVAPQSEPQVGDTYNGQTITSLWIGDKALPSYGIPYWTSAVNEQAEHVVFMPEFANARPTSCYYWFYYFKKINEFEGLEYLNTSQVTDMTQMFDDCWSLEKINVNNFDMTNVTSVNKMFFLCTSLTTIWCDSTWNIANSDNMFTYDDYLVGATAYRDSRISNGTKANPVDGYFTGSLPITVSVTGNGTVTAPESAFSTFNTSVNVTPGLFSTLVSFTIIGDATNNEIETENNNGVYTFTMPNESVTINVVFESPDSVDAVLWCEGNTTLYFVSLPTDIMSDGTWDGQNITQVWYGNNVTNVGWSTPGWNSVKDNVTCVVFDESFAAVKPKSCYSWFFSFKNLATIEGLSNLNTADVNNMNSMFLSCKALTTIDVNTFDVSKVTNATAMFRQCENLTTIYCDSTWNISTSGSMFLGDTKLVGAVAYNSNYQGGNMANPVTGYFTGKWDINIADIQGGTVTCELSEAYTNETVTLTVAPNEGKVFDSLVVLCGTDTVAVTAGDNNQYTFVMPAGDVNVNATFTVKDECTLAEALKLDNGDAAKVVAPIIVAAIVGEHAYVTDNDGHWARLDFANAQTAESIVVGTCFDWFNGTLANRDTAPTFTVTDEEHDPNASEIVNIASINLANEFEMPELNEVVEFSGYYVNGKLRAYSNGEGQSLTLATDFAQPELVEGTYYTLRVGVEVEEPWSNPAPRRVKLAYDYDFQNLKGQMIEVVNDQMPTAINSVNADKVGDNKWYTIDGRVLNTKPTSTGIYIHNGRKVIVK